MRTKAAAKPKRTADFPGWRSTDEQEVERRRLRALAEPLSVRSLTGKGFYGDFAVASGARETPYRVEVRALSSLDNSCSCMDYRKNGLGTCKHIEAVLHSLRQRGAWAYSEAARAGSPFVEVFLARRGEPTVRVLWPARVEAAVRRTLDPFFGSDGALLADPVEAIPSLERALAAAPARVRAAVRIAQDVQDHVADLARRAARAEARVRFLEDVSAGKRTLDVVKATLYPYQQEGMLHLAFAERALLADEMGLGKTVQAIAACELLRRTRRVERALVISPASLKAEWEEQIGKFTDLPARLIFGPRGQRLRLYREPAFFYLCNYEQAVSDWKEMNEIIAPDIVILDEAQRIKNWQTKTARTIKRLSSPFAFVLTGTPLENRIDEVYSIVEFLDPSVFGPLFRFNRDFYELDEKGRPVGLKNVVELNRRLRPVMLRRRKDEVEEQLPPRTVKNFFVRMEPEQRERYEDFNARVAKLVAASHRRPLTQEEFDKLQRWLACMRMICDTPFILDSDCDVCPKLGELEAVLSDLAQSGENKAIVFSEWERMLTLVRDTASRMKLEFAWHTGSVPQPKRRQEIRRFKEDPGCRLFLSTDSGATGLNLQAANVVINLDLPWNPAKLEQRIARAWRKHQTRSVSVLNFVCEDSIEHRMLGMLAQKQQLAEGVLDGRGDLSAIRLPSGRAAFMDRLASLMGAAPGRPAAGAVPTKPAGPADPLDRFRQDMVARLESRLLRIETHERVSGQSAVVAVVDGPADQVRPVAERLLRDNFAAAGGAPSLEVLDRATFETIQRLVDAGVLRLEGARTLYGGSPTAGEVGKARDLIREAVGRLMADARRKARMSAVLRDGGFAAEALPSMRDAVELGLKALAVSAGERPDGLPAEVPLALAETRLVTTGLMSAEGLSAVARLRAITTETAPLAEDAALALLADADRLLAETDRALARSSLS